MNMTPWLLRHPMHVMVQGGSEPWARDKLMCGRGVWLNGLPTVSDHATDSSGMPKVLP